MATKATRWLRANKWTLIWCLPLIPLWFGGYWVLLADPTIAEPSGPVGVGNLIIAGAVVFALITLLSYAPILILKSFLRSEKRRAEEAALTELTQQGWAAPLRERVERWYRTVFDEDRYPIPATLALLTFFTGWGFAFFHNGADFIAVFSVDGKLVRLVESISSGPPVSFAFLGSYFFAVQLLLRRYLGGDLGPGAFLYVTVRTWAVVILAVVLDTLLRATPLQSVAADQLGAVIAGTVFVGALTPPVLLQLITTASLRRLNRRLGAPTDETSLTALPGMNPWKAARLAEEGIDNVQNLAMEDPSRLVVVTREGGLRILDWIDQALLWTACSEDDRTELGRHGIRSAFGLYLAFQQDDLIADARPRSDPVRRYHVKQPATDLFGVDAGTLRNILTGVVHAPNFEVIRQMREQALRSAGEMFQTMERPPSTAAADVADSAAIASVLDQILSLGGTGVMLVRATPGSAPTATGVAVDKRFALTVIDAAEAGRAWFSGLVSTPAHDPTPIAGSLAARDESSRLALFELEEPVESYAQIEESDPGPGTIVSVLGGYSGVQRSEVLRIATDVQVLAGDRRVKVDRAILLAVSVSPGDGGAPVVDEKGRLVGIVVAGAPDAAVAVPPSAISRLLAGHAPIGQGSRPHPSRARPAAAGAEGR